MDSKDPIFGPLNELQKKAVETLNGPVLILAGAGSGKTRTLTHRIANLMANGVPAWNILAVTFTNKAANEMKERIKSLLKITSGEGTEITHVPTMGTFHSLCARILRKDIHHLGFENSFVIYDTDDQEKLMKVTLEELKYSEKDIKPKVALSVISAWKSQAVSAEKARSRATTFTEEKAATIYAKHQEKLKAANALDFDDLLLHTVRLFQECPDVLARYQHTWQYLHVDEYQDTNHTQYMIISALASVHRNICVIGDPDQSIYRFRGADIQNILDFQQEYKDAACITLEQNYRSTQKILDAADGVIGANPNRPPKKMWTMKAGGSNICLKEVSDERMEAEEAIRAIESWKQEGIPLSAQAILYRTNAQSRLFEETCLRHGLPYRIVGGVKFYARKEVKDVLAYLFVILNPQDTISLLRIINVPARKIGLTTIGRLQAFCNERNISLWQVLEHIEMVDGITEAIRIRLGNFRDLILSLRSFAQTNGVAKLAEQLVLATSLEKYIRDGTEEGESRWENVRELLSVMHKYDPLPPQDSLTQFLEEASLIAEVDRLEDGGEDAITLMTTHLCKGLEFRAVIVGGCEEGVFPHSRALFDREQMEEERRLMYVAMTRAQDHLMILHARMRMLWGNAQSNARSRFLEDIPQTVIDMQSDEITSKYGWLASAKPNPMNSFAAQRSRMANEFSQIPLRRAEQQHDEWSQETSGDSENEIDVGTRIAHKTFGEGTVIALTGFTAEILFESGMKKKLALTVAPIKILK